MTSLDQLTEIGKYYSSNDKSDETLKTLSESAENATGEEAEFYKITRDYLAWGKLGNDRWNESVDAVQAQRILD